MGGDGNPEQPENPTKPQETRGISRRHFLKAAGMAGGLVAASKFMGPLARVAGVEGAPLDTTVLTNPSKEGQELEQRPPVVYSSPFLNTDSAGNVQSIYTIAEAYNADGSRVGDILYRADLEQNDQQLNFKALTRFPYDVSSKVVFDALSVAALGDSVLVGGKMFTWNAEKIALFFSPNGGKTFTEVAKLPFATSEAVNEIRLIGGTRKALFIAPGFETAGAVGVFDFDTQVATKISLADNSGWSISDGLIVTDAEGGRVRVLSSPWIVGAPDWGYLDATFDLLTGQTSSVQIKHQDLNYLTGFHAAKDQAGLVDKIYAANIYQVFYTVDGKTDAIIASLPFARWLNNRNIPNYIENSLDIKAIQVIGNTVWAGGAYGSSIDGVGRAVVLSWTLGTDPNADPRLLKVYRLEDGKPTDILRGRDLQFGIFNGKPGFLTYVYNLGFAFIETTADGRPIPGILPLYIGRGVGELPPLNRTYLPFLNRDTSGK